MSARLSWAEPGALGDREGLAGALNEVTLLCSGASWAPHGQGSLKADQGIRPPCLRGGKASEVSVAQTVHFQLPSFPAWAESGMDSNTGENHPPAHRFLSTFFCILSGSRMGGGHHCSSFEIGVDQSLEKRKSVACPGSARSCCPSGASSSLPAPGFHAPLSSL